MECASLSHLDEGSKNIQASQIQVITQLNQATQEPLEQRKSSFNFHIYKKICKINCFHLALIAILSIPFLRITQK